MTHKIHGILDNNWAFFELPHSAELHDLLSVGIDYFLIPARGQVSTVQRTQMPKNHSLCPRTGMAEERTVFNLADLNLHIVTEWIRASEVGIRASPREQ
jgi:hypothetical protein